MKLRFSWLILLALPLAAQVKLTQEKDRVGVEIDGKPFTTFYVSGDIPKPFLHPLRAASGKIVTRMYPMETTVEGEKHDHPHHRGLWFTHGDVNGFDYWANEPSQKSAKKGRVALKSVKDVVSGKASGGVAAVFEWQDPEGKPLLNESRRMTFYSDPALRAIDFDITLTAIAKARFGDTKEGTFAIRLAPSLEEPNRGAPEKPKRTGKMVNAEGMEGEKDVWGKRSPWVDYYGEVDGEKLGIAILDHPSNPRHPTYWHSRSYGLFAANIFGEHDFLSDKTRDGSMTLEPKQSLRFRYRVVIHPGDYQSAGIAGIYKKYAAAK